MSGAPVIDENGNVTSNCFQLGDDPRNARPVQLAPAAAPAPASAQVRPAAIVDVKGGEPISATQLIKQIRERLKVVEREIKLRSKLEDERAKLNRLLSAAKAERDNVRRLRSA